MPWGIARTGADSNSNEGADFYFLGTILDSDHADLTPNIGALDNGQDVVGMAAQVTLHTAKICNSRGLRPNSGTATAALDWVTSEVTARGEAAAVNMSIGGNGSVTGTGTFTNNGFVGNDSYHEAICNARNAGVVVAAGNSSDNAANYTPAGYSDTVITVSSAKEGDDWNRFSNWGSASASWTSNNSAPVAIAAPGRTILFLGVGGGTAIMSGTSMASPHVAGGL